ncbi:hypothetical protein GGF45_004967, partial [Coemansia sp. RSA 551]
WWPSTTTGMCTTRTWIFATPPHRRWAVPQQSRRCGASVAWCTSCRRLICKCRPTCTTTRWLWGWQCRRPAICSSARLSWVRLVLTTIWRPLAVLRWPLLSRSRLTRMPSTMPAPSPLAPAARTAVAMTMASTANRVTSSTITLAASIIPAASIITRAASTARIITRSTASTITASTVTDPAATRIVCLTAPAPAEPTTTTTLRRTRTPTTAEAGANTPLAAKRASALPMFATPKHLIPTPT